MGDRIWIGHLESSFLEIFAEIEDRAAHEERAFRIDHHSHILGLDEDVSIGRAIDQIHFILQAGATAADHRHAQRAVGPPLFLQEGSEFTRRGFRHPNEALVADLVFDFAVRRTGCGHKGNYRASPPAARPGTTGRG